MQRLLLAGAVAVATLGMWWLMGAGGLEGRLAGLGDRIAEQIGDGQAPNWGDVADKVGEFAREERGLKETVGGPGDAIAPGNAPDTR